VPQAELVPAQTAIVQGQRAHTVAMTQGQTTFMQDQEAPRQGPHWATPRVMLGNHAAQHQGTTRSGNHHRFTVVACHRRHNMPRREMSHLRFIMSNNKTTTSIKNQLHDFNEGRGPRMHKVWCRIALLMHKNNRDPDTSHGHLRMRMPTGMGSLPEMSLELSIQCNIPDMSTLLCMPDMKTLLG